MREANQLQNTGAWFNERTGKLTASRMAAAMSFLKAKKDEEPREASERRKLKIEILAERLTGDIVPKYVTQEMQWGIDKEPAAKEAFTKKTGMEVTDIGFVEHPHIELCGCSPDGLLMEAHELLEVKCPSTATMISWWMEAMQDKDWVPEEYKPQMALQSSCFGGAAVWFCAFDPRLPERNQLIIRRFQPTPEYLFEIEAQAKKFLGEIDAMFEQLTLGE